MLSLLVEFYPLSSFKLEIMCSEVQQNGLIYWGTEMRTPPTFDIHVAKTLSYSS